jgi:hypothetical protein
MAETQTHEPLADELERLIREIGRYLAAVDEFRRQEREPRWLPEKVDR